MFTFRHYIIGPTLVCAVGLGVMAARGSTSDADRVRAVFHNYNAGWAKADPTVCRRYLTATAHRYERGENVRVDLDRCEKDIAWVFSTPEQRKAVNQMRIKRVTFAQNHTKAIIREEDVEVPDLVRKAPNGHPIVLLKDRTGQWRIDDLG